MSNLGHKCVWGALLILLFLHAVQVASPLRLNTDSQHFLTCAAAAADSPKFFPLADSKPHPPGYATLLAILDRGGLGSAPVLAFVNVASIALGVFASQAAMQRAFKLRRETAIGVGVITLLSFVVIKHAVIPLSDLPFFGVVMTCLYCLVRGDAGPNRVYWLLLAGGFAVLAVSLRTIGVALFPALLWAICAPRRRLALGLLFGCGLIGVLALTQTAYAAHAIRHFESGDALGIIVNARLNEFGELAMNLPMARLPWWLKWCVPVLGGLSLVILASGIRQWRSGGVVEIFVMAFAGVLFIWPFEDTRFWLPILPVLVTFSFLGAWRLPWVVSGVWLIWFAIFGVVALVFSTRLTISGAQFAERYGDGSQRAAYRAALLHTQQSADVDEALLYVLRRYEPRAR